ncbi:uncharacterized protein LOC132243550 [Alligator mississippiensis]|uniref:uncharacterized protein LOC132243550 n=1 Tax=Alligator mississippiensis TaxID=8496 RepID=UPI00287778AC|nr:uncharacterized protein LOC132243550 [Alligator mississippiensis]
METLDEFDDEYPLSMSFCKLISLEDFEEQSLSYTEQCLQELVTNMEQSPGICERVMRKRKQVEKEEAGLVSFLKAKFFGTLQGEMNCCNYVGIAEMQEKVAQLKRDIQKANSYARAAKSGKVRHPRHIAGKHQALEGGFCRSHTSALQSASAPKVTMPRVFGPFPQLMNKQMDRATASNTDLKYHWAGVSTMNQKSMIDLHPIVLNPAGFYTSLQTGNHINKLRHTSFLRPLGINPTPSQKPGPSGTKSAASVFNTPMLAKFQVGSEDDMDNEKPGPSSPPKGA